MRRSPHTPFRTPTSGTSRHRGVTTLQWALGVSLLVHGSLLTLRWASPQTFQRVFQDTPLEVVLVNARSAEPPDRAQAVAQANLMGGGDAARGRATSPLPPTSHQRDGNDSISADERRLDAMKTQQARLLAQIRQQLAQYPSPQPHSDSATPAQKEQERKRQQMVKLLAEIEKRIQEENARPRRHYVSPATREAVYAMYYDQLRRRIETHGTANFPEAGGKKLYGELTMVITVNRDGRVLETEVVDSSGQRALDQRAQAIVRALSFGPFTDGMLRRADQIVVVSRFRFTRQETLNATVSQTP